MIVRKLCENELSHEFSGGDRQYRFDEIGYKLKITDRLERKPAFGQPTTIWALHMPAPTDHVWTQQQFDEMSWHDNHVHAIRVEEGEHGAGKLILDIDYILEWVNDAGGKIKFSILPATLTFHEVTNLRMSIDYATPTAALGPISIHAIERRTEQRERYAAQMWKIVINWPIGELTFEAQGYEQRGIGTPLLTDNQWLQPQQRTQNV